MIKQGEQAQVQDPTISKGMFFTGTALLAITRYGFHHRNFLGFVQPACAEMITLQHHRDSP